MTTTYEEISGNQVKEADLSTTPFDESSAKYLADALRANTSIDKLTLSMSNIDDEGFKLISDALQSREKNLLELNIDSTDITSTSLPDIKKLIENGKVKSLLMYRLVGIHETTEVTKELNSLAQSKGVKISFDHPWERESPGFFSRRQTKQGDNSPSEEKKLETPRKNSN